MLTHKHSKEPDRCEIVSELHEMMHEQLFGNRPWIADREVGCAIRRKLFELGLQIRVLDTHITDTALGKELQMPLMRAFLGLWCEWEVPMTLYDYGLIDKVDEDQIYFELGENCEPDRVLRPWVRRAYVDYYRLSHLSN
jgi:hypothetical protein